MYKLCEYKYRGYGRVQRNIWSILDHCDCMCNNSMWGWRQHPMKKHMLLDLLELYQLSRPMLKAVAFDTD